MKHRTVLLDVDGVLADFLSTVLRLAGVGVDKSQIIDWDLRKCLSPAAHRRVTDLLSFSDSIAKHMDVMPGAQRAVDTIRETGFGVVAVTSPWLSNPTWEHQRRAWLRAKFDIRPENIISTPAKHLVDGAVLVDDKAEAVERWSAVRGRPAILFRHPYGGDPSGPFISGWTARDLHVVLDHAVRAVTGPLAPENRGGIGAGTPDSAASEAPATDRGDL